LRLTRPALVTLIATALLTAGVSPGSASAATPGPWSISDVPNPAGGFGDQTSLKDVVAVSASEVWAVGRYGLGNDLHAQSARWNGTAWQQVAVPSYPTSELQGVDVTSAGKVWAAGSATENGVSRGLLLKRTGGDWVRVPTPAVGAAGDHLLSIDMIAQHDGWAVGSSATDWTGTTTKNLILRYDGTNWVETPSPSIATGVNRLLSVSADGPNSAWAVGDWAPPNNTMIPAETVALHWNGTQWTRVASPSPGAASAGFNTFNRVLSLSPTNAWAIGTASPAGAWVQRRPLIARWNGVSWAEVTMTPPDALAFELTDLYAAGPDDIYFVGYKGGAMIRVFDHDFIRHWNGTEFSTENLLLPPMDDWNPNGDRIVSALSGVTGLPTGELWAVGHTTTTVNHVLTKHP
jgi:hypothetical protein